MMRPKSIALFRWFPLATLALAGCSGDAKPKVLEKPFAGLKLVVAVVDDAALLPSIKSQRGEWSARTGAEVTVLDRPITPEGLAESKADVVVFPGDRMGDLIDLKALATIADAVVLPPEPTPAEGSEPTPEPTPDEFKYKDIVAGYRDQVTRYGPDRVALPLGGSALVVAFHRSAFDSPANQEAAKAAG
jgi:multiple sugar transport system substrate-binding protein